MVTRLFVAVVVLLCASVLPTAYAEPEPRADAEPHTGQQVPQDFAITAEVPSLAELDTQIRLLVATPAPDAVKAAQLEGGNRAVIVPKMIYRIGFFRPPRGSSMVTGPETHEVTRHTAVINARRQGAPTVQITAEWRRVDGRWKLANKSLCSGVKTVGLPIPCNFR